MDYDKFMNWVDRSSDIVERLIYRVIIGALLLSLGVFLIGHAYRIQQEAVIRQQTPPIELRR